MFGSKRIEELNNKVTELENVLTSVNHELDVVKEENVNLRNRLDNAEQEKTELKAADTKLGGVHREKLATT